MKSLQTAETPSFSSDYDPTKFGGFAELLGMEKLSMADGKASFRLTIDQRHLRPMEMAHGGVIAALMDTAISMSAVSLLPAQCHAVTVQLSVSYTRPALLGETVIAHGECQHRGTKTAVVRGEIHNTNGKLIATGSATMMFLPLPEETNS